MTSPIICPHNDYAAIEVSRSRDGNRVSLSVMLRQRGRWIAGGPAPSIPSTMLDTAIDALVQMRDSIAMEGQ